MFLIIDNYDSFTYNLVQYLGELDVDVEVRRNDRTSLEEIAALDPEAIVISPGPGGPEDAGVSLACVEHFAGRIPIFGVCLGHQCIGYSFGARIVRAAEPMHGKTSTVTHDGKTIFAGLPNPLTATRYHSLIVTDEHLPPCLEVSARTPAGEIMGLRHRQFPVEGVQFHPESILTDAGKSLLGNVVAWARRWKPALIAADRGRRTDGTPGQFAGQYGKGGSSMTAASTQQAKATIDIREAIARAVDGIDLSVEEARCVMDSVMGGHATPAQIAAWITALRMKGETVEEIAGCALSMRTHAVRISPRVTTMVDTCGTGGDGSHTFNVSTAAAFVVAGAGVPVAKHGNRSVSSRCGSADVLEALGIDIELEPEAVARCIEETGFGFMFAPRFHQAMKHAVGPRREIGIRTVFNALGPLTNPAGTPAQVIGVFHSRLTELLAQVLSELGLQRAYVVHGHDGLDELSIRGPSRVSELRDGQVRTYDIVPEDAGLTSQPDARIAGGNAEQNARIIEDILAGERGPHRDLVLLNAAAALAAAGAVDSLRSGVELAAESIDSGRAGRILQAVREMAPRR